MQLNSLLRASTLLLALSFPLIALGQANTPTKFYQFEGFTLKGTVQKPGTEIHYGKDRVKFDRLLELKKSFLPEIIKSSQDRSLK
jgi:hypothetical protein